jgi:hypothetical protein
MAKGTNLALEAPVTIETTAGRKTDHPHPEVPWWLLIIPAALLTMILLVAELAVLMASLPPEAVEPDEDPQIGLPVVEEVAVTDTAPSTPAFTR